MSANVPPNIRRRGIAVDKQDESARAALVTCRLPKRSDVFVKRLFGHGNNPDNQFGRSQISARSCSTFAVFIVTPHL
jgi:hypothetical protein